jgi:hypothetical protein
MEGVSSNLTKEKGHVSEHQTNAGDDALPGNGVHPSARL